MQNSFKLLACLSVSSSLVTALPSNAQTTCASGGLSAATLIGYGSIGCSIGDAIYYDFSFTGFHHTSFGFSNVSSVDHIFGGHSLALTTPASYNYKVKIAPGFPSLFYGYLADSSGDFGFNATYALTAAGGGTVTSSNGNLSSPYIFYPSTPGPLAFTGTITPAVGAFHSFSNTIVLEVPEVPGPLPLLGAGVAFGFSRKLRQRVKASS
jgi:hypothetical protein